jgi:ADP-ribose pyrophosphatase
VDHLVDMCNPFYTTPGKTNEKIHLFFASVSKKISNGGGLETENEDIEVIEIEKNDIPSLGIEDGKTLLALALYNIKSQI